MKISLAKHGQVDINKANGGYKVNVEKLDYYDEYMNLIGSESRDVVHEKGLWHKTVHCWLYDKQGNVYFQIRKDSNKLYTSASGHVLAGETIKQAFHREVMEEIGVNVGTDNASLVEINVWKLDKNKNGKPFRDRAFANVYLNCIDSSFVKYNFDPEEVLGVVKVNAKECLKLFQNECKEIEGTKITDKTQKITVTLDNFLVFSNEIALLKYGKILQSVISLTQKTSTK